MARHRFGGLGWLAAELAGEAKEEGRVGRRPPVIAGFAPGYWYRTYVRLSLYDRSGRHVRDVYRTYDVHSATELSRVDVWSAGEAAAEAAYGGGHDTITAGAVVSVENPAGEVDVTIGAAWRGV